MNEYIRIHVAENGAFIGSEASPASRNTGGVNRWGIFDLACFLAYSSLWSG